MKPDVYRSTGYTLGTAIIGDWRAKGGNPSDPIGITSPSSLTKAMRIREIKTCPPEETGGDATAGVGT